MSQNNLNTESEKLTSETPCMLLHFVSGDIIIGEVIGFNSRLIVVRTPLDINITYDDEGSPESFNLQPYLQPFSLFTSTTQVNFNLNLLISVTKPHDLMVRSYRNAIEKMFSDDGDETPDNGEELPEPPPGPPNKILYH